MEADRLYSDPELVQFYDLENGWGADFDMCRNLARGCSSLLDLGCGTGQFAAAVAQEIGCDVVGVDPAMAMLEVAARRPGAEHARWVQGDARTLRLGRRFDLIVLTGHAFQVFLTEGDRIAVLRTIAAHLMPKGRFVFDSRNPTIAAWRNWTPEQSRRVLQHPVLGPVVAWNDASFDPTSGIVTYGTHYKVVATDRLLESRSQIAFPSQEQLAVLMTRSGLTADRWLGDWSGTAYTPASAEIVVDGALAAR